MTKDMGGGTGALMRLKDLRLTAELLVEAVAQEDGARERIAKRYDIQKSVITNRVERIERFFDVALFTGPQRKTPTAAGKVMARYGPKLLEEIEFLGTTLKEAREWGELP